ncbi:MAG: hypothetical protein OHK0015_51100 [Chloroflexi bacterium OHK40]
MMAPVAAIVALRRAAPALLAGLLAATLLTLALSRPRPATVDVGAPGDAYALAGFYGGEGAPAFRWSGPGSRLLLPAAYDGPLALTLRLHAPPGAPPEGQTLRLLRDGVPVARLVAAPTFRLYHVLLPPDQVPEPAPLRMELLELAAAPVYAPGDPRPLGVALDGLILASAPGAPPPPGPLLERSLALAGAVALGAGFLALAGLPAALVGSLAAGFSVALAAWAWRDPLGFAWAVPAPSFWLLALGTLLVLVLGAPARVMLRRSGGRGGYAAVTWGYAGWAALLVLSHVLLLAPPPWAGLGALAVMLAPGALAALALFPDERGPAVRPFLVICGSLTIAPLLVLALHALPGPLPWWLLLLAADGLTAAVALLALRGRGSPAQPLPPTGARSLGLLPRLWLAPEYLSERSIDTRGAGAPQNGIRGRFPGSWFAVLALVVALGLRLWHLGSAEFQGDEARAMLLAVGVAQGADGILLTHTKGPVEALLPAGALILGRTGAEWVARLPFALASLGVLLGTLAFAAAFLEALGQGPGVERRAPPGAARAGASPHALSERSGASSALAGPIPVVLLAVDGFAVAFGRIVQYQSVVMLAMTGALWCCWRFYAGAERPRRALVAAAVMLALGLLAHYDAVMVVPTLAWLVLAGGWRRGWRGMQWAVQLGTPVALGAVLLASFFVPYVFGPAIRQTAEYLLGRASEGDAGGPPFNNLALYVDILSFYNAPPLVPLLAVALLASLAVLLLRYGLPRPLGVLLAATLILAAAAQLCVPELFVLPGGASWAGLAWGAPLLGLCLAPAVPGPVRATALWFTTAFCAEAFVIAEPRTHFYTAHVPAALLVGLAAAAAPPLLARRALPVAAASVLLAGGLYGQLVYLRQVPEFQRLFPAARPDVLRARFGDVLPEAGYFGFPHRDGWKAVAELYRQGVLRGTYATNQNRWLAGWYLRDATPCTGQPDLYLIAQAEPTVYYPPGYALLAEVYAGPVRALAIYGREPPTGAPRRYALEALSGAFDRRPLEPFPAVELLTGTPPPCRR